MVKMGALGARAFVYPNFGYRSIWLRNRDPVLSRIMVKLLTIHDVAPQVGEKRSLGSELPFVHFYIIIYRVPKYSITQSLHLYNPFKLDAGINRN